MSAPRTEGTRTKGTRTPAPGPATSGGAGSAAPQLPPTVVSFDGVTKRFSETVFGLNEVTLDISRGGITVLLGLSGSGKSTFLRHVNGLQQPTSGRIKVLGQNIERAKSKSLREMRRRIGFIFQDFNLVGPMSVLENVCAGRLGSLRGPRLTLMAYPKQLRCEALEQLDRVGLGDRAYQRADTLSGGQQQRVAIARALIQRPEILLADEPVASLDPVSSSGVIDLIKQISREEKLTVICSLHQVEIAMGFADRIVGLRAGKMVLDRKTASLSEQDVLNIYSKVGSVPDYPDFDEQPGAHEIDTSELEKQVSRREKDRRDGRPG